MDICFVGQVHQIVDQQAIVAGDGIISTLEGPSIRGAWPQIGDFLQVGRRVTHPYPDKPVTFMDNKCFRTNPLVYRIGLQRHFFGDTVRADFQAMIFAAERIAFLDPHREGQHAVWAGIAHGDDFAIQFAPQNNRYAQ